MPVTLAVRVLASRDLDGAVRELTLRALDGAPLPAFSAGSHVVVHLPLPQPRFNAYSLASSPWSTDTYRIAVRRDDSGAGGSRWVHERLAVGDVLSIELPRNHFPLVATARRHVLVAGGIGITPFVAYAHRLRRDGTPFELHYAVRERAGATLLDELAELCGDALTLYADPTGAQLLAALEQDVLPAQPLGTHLSTCGPGPMMDAVLAAARRHGWPDSRLHLERFAATTGPREPFVALLGAGGRRVDVAAETTLLEALEAAGAKVPFLCRQGVCGECRTGLLDGEPDHRDVFLTPQERAACDQLMPCVSRAQPGSTLVLDLA